MAKKKSRLLRQAAAEADVKYGADEGSLQALLGQAHQDLKNDIRVAKNTAGAAAHVANAARPQLYDIYKKAAQGVVSSKANADAAFGRAGVGSENPFVLANEASSAAYRQRLTTASAQARAAMKQTAADAKLGSFFAQSQARQAYRGTRQQLIQRQSDLTGEKASFITQRLGELRTDRANRKNQRDVASIQQGIDPKTGKAIPGGKADRAAQKAAGEKGFKPASRSEHRMFTNEFDRLYSVAQGYADHGDRATVARNLRAGIPSVPLGKKSGKRTATVTASKDPLALRAALDMAFAGHLSNETLQELHKVGMKANDLSGAKTRKQYANRYGNKKQLAAKQLRASRLRAKQYEQGNVY